MEFRNTISVTKCLNGTRKYFASYLDCLECNCPGIIEITGYSGISLGISGDEKMNINCFAMIISGCPPNLDIDNDADGCLVDGR